jgi:hypothetical protein
MQGHDRTREGLRLRHERGAAHAGGDCHEEVDGTPARLFWCHGCRVQVLICSHCDRGHMFCVEGCAREARRHSQRDAGRRYQTSRRGRLNHAARSRRHWVRKNNRFNPTLLDFARHYRCEPRPVAIARGNEKGRVERAVRYVRDFAPGSSTIAAGGHDMSDAELFTVHGAAEVLRRDRRSVKIALRNTTADHTDNQGRARWRLPRVAAALAAYDRARGAHGSHERRGDPRLPAAGNAVEDAAAAVEAGLLRLKAERDIGKRRAIVEANGVPLGALDRAFEQANALLAPDEVQLVRPFCDEVMRMAIGELMRLCDWRLDLGEPAAV